MGTLDMKNAITAIQAKISTAATSATAEELAYLGTAVDRIGGRATVYEVVETGEIVKSEISALNTTLQDSMHLDFTAKTDAAILTVNNTMASMVASAKATETTTLKHITDQQASTNTFITNAQTVAQGNITDTKVAAEAHVTATKLAAELEIDSKKTVALAATKSSIDAAVLAATTNIAENAAKLQSAAVELSAAASLANTQAVNSSLFTMLVLAGL